MDRWGLVSDKRCPRCGGNIEVQEDQYGKEVKCMQCGRPYNLEIPQFIFDEIEMFKQAHAWQRGRPRGEAR